MFKVGDKVRVIAVSRNDRPRKHTVGKIGTVVVVGMESGNACVEFSDDDNWLYWYGSRELELIAEGDDVQGRG